MDIKYFILLLLVIVGCSKEVDIEQPAYKSKIAVDGWIEDNGFVQVILTRSSPFLTDYDSASIRNTFLNYAKVTVTTGSGESEVLTLFKMDEFFPPFIFRSIRIQGKPGETYHLKVEASGETVTASTTIPEPPLVNAIRMKALTDTTATIEAQILDRADEDNYYYTEIYTRGFDTRFHPSSRPLFTDESFSGQMASVTIGRTNQPDPLGIHNIDFKRNIPPREYAITDTVLVKISCLDRASFRVLNAIYLDHLSNDNPFSFVDKKTTTNIEGGIGRWTGKASVTRRVYFIK